MLRFHIAKVLLLLLANFLVFTEAAYHLDTILGRLVILLKDKPESLLHRVGLRLVLLNLG